MDDYSFLKPISPSVLTRSRLLDGLDGLSALTSSTKSSSGSDTSDFKDLLLLMLKGFNNSSSMSLFGSESSSDSNMFGFSSSMMMMPLMLTLLEKMMALDTQEQAAASTLSSGKADSMQINQFDAELQGGGDGINANCGPTSLAIALHALGLKVAGENASTSEAEVVDLARKSMVIDPGRDGVDESGARSDAEHNTFTDLGDLMRGAQAAGAKTSLLSTDTETLRKALEKGAKVLVSGTFVDKSPLPWTGDRGSDDQTAPGFATKHIIAVTGYDTQTGKFTINDPARSTSIRVNAATLSHFMSGNAGAVAIFK